MMGSPRRPRAIYSHSVIEGIIVIRDHDGTQSVTNEAENVLDDLVRIGCKLKEHRVIYMDTQGAWAEIVKDCTGKFAGFRNLNTNDFDAALAQVR